MRTRLEARLTELQTAKQRLILQAAMIDGAIGECENSLAWCKEQEDGGIGRNQERHAEGDEQVIAGGSRFVDDAAEG